MTAPTLHQPSDYWWEHLAGIKEPMTLAECRHLLDAIAAADPRTENLGTHTVISGGEVYELPAPNYDEPSDEEIPF